MANEVKIMLYDSKAVAEFSKTTAPELKEKFKSLPWLKWSKKEVGEKTYWKLNIDLSEGQENLNSFISLMFEHDIEVQIKDNKESDWHKIENIGDTDPKLEKAKPYSIYMKPSYVEELKKIAENKHISLSTLVIIALDNYLQNQRPAMVVDSFAEKVRIEIAKRQTKPAWVADQLNIPRSTFSSKLAANNFTREEQERITRYFGWRTEA